MSSEMQLLERERPLQQLASAHATAASGQGCLVAVAGEAGAGKTSLVEHFAAACVADDKAETQIYWGGCEHLSTPEPLLPLRDIARTSVGHFHYDPNTDRLSTFDSLLQLIGVAQAAVLILEDVHWADAATLDLIRYLARRVRRTRALVVVTYREEEVGRSSQLRQLLGEAPRDSIERLQLAPLSLSAVTLLARGAGRDGEALYALTGGNPFFVTEALAVEGNAASGAVRDATLARAARLPENARRLLELVSIFPRRADAELVSALVGENIETALDACVDKGMLTVNGDDLKFRHEIARRAIEDSLAPANRRTSHQRLVDILTAQTGARASEIAHHAERAEDIDNLVKYARRAGEDAVRARAPREAVAHFSTLLKYRKSLTDTAVVEILEHHAVQSHLSGDPHTALQSMGPAARLRSKRGETMALGRDLGWLVRFSWVSGQRNSAEQYADKAIAVLSRLAPGRELAWAYSFRSQIDMLGDNHDNAIDWGRRAIALADQLDDVEIAVHAMSNVGSSQLYLGDMQGQEISRRGLELATREGLHDHVARAYTNLTCTALLRRDYPQVLDVTAEGAEYAAARDLTHWEFHLRYGWRSVTHIDLGDWTRATEDAQVHCAQTHMPGIFRFPGQIATARLRIRRGEPDADTPLAEMRKVATGLDELQHSTYLEVLEAERIWLSGDLESPHGREVIARLRTEYNRARARRVPCFASEMALWLYLLGENLGDLSLLLPTFRNHCAGRWRQAAADWNRIGCPYEEALALSEGDEESQRRALSIFDRLGAVPAAVRLRRQMRTEGATTIPRGPLARTRANPAGLTRRQMQVLALLREGLGNASIAERLSISAKTAEHHVSAILSRLNASSRREAVIAAEDFDLIRE